VLVAREVALITAAVLAVVLAAVLVDYGIRMPGAMRIILWIIGLLTLLAAVSRRVGRAAGFCPTLVDMALRVERVSGVPEAKGLIASGLEFDQNPPAHAVERGLARAVAERAKEVFSRVKLGEVVNLKLLFSACVLLVAAMLATGAPAAARPDLAAIGAERVLFPFTDQQWPRRTLVEDATQLAVHPLGVAVPIRARLVRTDAAEGRTRVVAETRLTIDGRTGQWRSAPLSAQRTQAGEAELYERLLEPTVPAGATEALLEYRIETKDDRTDIRSVRLIRPPRLAGISANITAPAYLPEDAAEQVVRGRREITSEPGSAELIGPVLAGSMVELALTPDRTLPTPDPETLEPWLRGTLGLGEEDPAPAFIDDGDTWRLTWTATISSTLRVTLTDDNGISSPEPVVLGFDIIDDRAPSAVLTEPDRDEAVLAGAIVPTIAEGRDDIGLASISIEISAERPQAGSDGAVAAGETVEVSSARGSGAELLTTQLELDLAQLTPDGEPLSPGDTLVIEAVARDVFASPEGELRGAVRSTPRRLLIIEEAELVERVRSELSAVRRSAIALDRDQAELADRVESGVVGPEAERDQASIGERAEGQRRAVERLAERLDRNRLEDQQLRDLLERASDSLGRAGEASQRAGEQIEEAAQADTASERRDAQADARTEQQRVRDELANLAEMLDRGEDDWLARRGIERLLEEQQRLQEETEALGGETVGRDLEELSPEQREQLSQLAEQQRALAERAEQAIEQLAEQSREAQQSDQQRAEALARAAARARSENVTEQIQQAGENLDQNQTAQAQQQQEDVIEALEEVLEDIDRAERGRDERLRRQLAELIDEIQRLVTMQQTEMDRLNATADDELNALAAGMIALHEATLGVADQARSGEGETASIATTLERAGASQTTAIVELRGATPQRAAVQRHEEDSLALLLEALEQAEALDEQAEDRQQQRARDELRKAYSRALAEQVAITEDTEPLIGRALNRRERRTVRGLGERQLALRAALDELLAETDGLSDAAVFEFAHRRLADVIERAGAAMNSQEATAAVLRDQRTSERILRSLVEALDQQPPEEDFREDGEGGGGGGGQGAGGEEELVPPIAQLKLLRAMQAEAYDRTRGAAELNDQEIVELEREQVGALQRGIADLANQMLEALQQQQQGGAEILDEAPGDPVQPPAPDREGTP